MKKVLLALITAIGFTVNANAVDKVLYYKCLAVGFGTYLGMVAKYYTDITYKGNRGACPVTCVSAAKRFAMSLAFRAPEFGDELFNYGTDELINACIKSCTDPKVPSKSYDEVMKRENLEPFVNKLDNYCIKIAGGK